MPPHAVSTKVLVLAAAVLEAGRITSSSYNEVISQRCSLTACHDI